MKSDQTSIRVYADLHIHSKFSRATSVKMDLPNIYHCAQLKGLNLIGTGDFTHPLWWNELQNRLIEIPDTGFYKLKSASQPSTYFILSSEVCTVSESEGKAKRIHHLLFTPTLQIAAQVNNKLRRYGDLGVDGRPLLKVSPPELVEEVMEVSKDNVVIPAHVWTPWFSLFGSRSGFDQIEDCYQDMTHHIFALETGLSSDPPMNWRLSSLDDYTLISNSDSHSPYPYRLGREANVLDLKEFTYYHLIEVLRQKDRGRFLYTIETNPAYGKYHWTGHRRCKISVPPAESKKLNGRCPICGKPLTRGVAERVDDLADRPPGFQPNNAIGYRHLLPLHEIIGMILGVDTFYAHSIWDVFTMLISTFGNEYSVLLNASAEKLAKIVNQQLVNAILKVRRDEINVIPGYDGIYGKLTLDKSNKTRFP